MKVYYEILGETMERDKKMERNQMMAVERQEDVIDLREVFYLIRSHWKALILAMLLGAILCGTYCTFMLKPSYAADAEIYIKSTDTVLSISDLQLSSLLTPDYSNIIKSRTVLNSVIEQLDLDLTYRELSSLIGIVNPDSSHILKLTVTCGDPELSRNIVNELVNTGSKEIYRITGNSMPTVIDYSEAEAIEEITPSLKKYLAIGALLGAVLVCGILILRMLTDTTLKTEEDIEKYLHLPVLTGVPYFRSTMKERK